jgi:hypothetical protein
MLDIKQYTDSSSSDSVLSMVNIDGYPVPSLKFEVQINDLVKSSGQVISLLFPQWSANELFFIQCTTGLTNKLVKVTHAPTSYNILVRIYGKGTEIMIDRRQEIRVLFYSYQEHYLLVESRIMSRNLWNI